MDVLTLANARTATSHKLFSDTGRRFIFLACHVTAILALLMATTQPVHAEGNVAASWTFMFQGCGGIAPKAETICDCMFASQTYWRNKQFAYTSATTATCTYQNGAGWGYGGTITGWNMSACPANTTTPLPPCICADGFQPDADGKNCMPASNNCPDGYQQNPYGAGCIPTPVSCTSPWVSNGTSCVCNPPNVVNSSGGCEPETYTLELEQALKDTNPGVSVEPGQTKNITVQVKNALSQAPKNGAKVSLMVKVESNTGGHEHDDPQRPKGTLPGAACDPPESSCATATTDPDGYASFTFTASEVSGTHTFTASCIGPACTGTDTGKINVKVPGLVPIPDSPFYKLQLPNKDTNHPNAHFLTEASQKKLETIAVLYMLKTINVRERGAPPDITLNDASLKWGGVLDCFLTCNSAQYPSTPWHEHHIEHRRGSVVDIKANGTSGSISYKKDFKAAAKKFGVTAGRLHGSGSGLHYHLRLNNGARE